MAGILSWTKEVTECRQDMEEEYVQELEDRGSVDPISKLD